MRRAVAAAGVRRMCAFNYRFVPAVRLRARADRGGRPRRDPPRPPRLPAGLGRRRRRAVAGASTRRRPARGALGDLGAHIVDLAPLPRRRAADVVSAPVERRSSRGGRESTTPSPATRRVRRRRRRDAGGTRFATGRVNALALRDQRVARRAAPSTSSGSTSCAIADARARASARDARHRARSRRSPPVVAARPRARLGAHLRPRVGAPARARSPASTASRPHGATFDDGYRAPRSAAIVRSDGPGVVEESPPDRGATGHGALGRAVERLDRARPGRARLAAEQRRAPRRGSRARDVLELGRVGVRGARPRSRSRRPRLQLDARRRARATGRRARCGPRRRRPRARGPAAPSNEQSMTCEHVAGEAQQAGEAHVDAVAAGDLLGA